MEKFSYEEYKLAKKRWDKKLKKITKLLKKIREEVDSFDELSSLCQGRAFNFSLTWQRITDWSLEIYTGYQKSSYKLRFYTDGHIDKEEAIKRGIEYMLELEDNKVVTKAPQF